MFRLVCMHGMMRSRNNATMYHVLVGVLDKPVGHAHPFHPFEKCIVIHEKRSAECNTDELLVYPFNRAVNILHRVVAFRHHVREHAAESIGNARQLAFSLKLEQQAANTDVSGKTQVYMRRIECCRNNERAHQFDTMRISPVLRLGTTKRDTSR